MGSILFCFGSLLPCATRGSSAWATHLVTTAPPRTAISTVNSASGHIVPRLVGIRLKNDVNEKLAQFFARCQRRTRQSRERATRIECTRMILHLQLDHVELALGRTAFRTNPVFGNVGPSGAGREAFIRVTLFLIIHVAAGPALPG